MHILLTKETELNVLRTQFNLCLLKIRSTLYSLPDPVCPSFTLMQPAFPVWFVVHPCEKEDNGGCQHKCNKQGSEASCSCNEGYQLNADTKTCDKSK